MQEYLNTLMTFGAEYAYRQLKYDIMLNYRGLSVKGTDKALAALIALPLATNAQTPPPQIASHRPALQTTGTAGHGDSSQATNPASLSATRGFGGR